MPIRLTRKGRAEGWNEKGRALDDAGRAEDALAAYREAARLAPEWAVPWFNIGLVHKYRGEWEPSRAANREALARQPAHEGATWNLGIAATALADWAAAREAWRRYGIAIADGEGPIEMNGGLTPIRVDVHGHPEVVWADRIDPARAIIRSVPTAECGRRYGDLLLHDGAPNGYRLLDGREVPVFDELELLKPSLHATFELTVVAVTEQDVDALEQLAGPADVHVENWTTNFRILCKACSEGRPFGDGDHDHPAPEAEDGMFRLGVAARTAEHALDVLRAWQQQRPRAELGSLSCILPAAAVH